MREEEGSEELRGYWVAAMNAEACQAAAFVVFFTAPLDLGACETDDFAAGMG